MNKYATPASLPTIEKTIESLKANGIDALVVENREQAKKKILELIPQGTEVMTMTSITLEQIGVLEELNNSGKYQSVRDLFAGADDRKRKRLGAAHDFAIGSVHAVTEDGHVLIASNTGSQLPAYSYGANRVIWVVGAQKIVKNFEDGLKRIYEYVLPLESERAHKAYGIPGSFVSKLLVVNKEVQPGRITLIFVKEVLGF